MHRCLNCGSTDLFTMELTVSRGPARFRHCRACEHRWWSELDGAGALALDDVLAS